MRGAAAKNRVAASPHIILHDWLEQEPRARVVLDSTNTIVWINAAARQHLADASCVTPRGERFAFASPPEQRRFEAYLAALGGALATIAIRLADGKSHFLFRSCRLESPDGVFACLEFARDTPFQPSRYLDFDTVFQLTKAEHRVALKLLDGQSAHQIAECSDVSIDTVRSQIRALYAKVGVSRREELFFRLAPYCVL